jgi:hypothetical protein
MESATATEKRAPALRYLAHVVSIVFHPLFISSYVAAFLVYIHPYAFAGLDAKLKMFRVIMVFFNTAFIPGFAVFLMWRLGLIKSIFLRTQQERIIPYVAAMICYFWAWLVTKNHPDNPVYFVSFMQGAFFAVCAAWMLNIYTKVSMHTIALGGALTFFLLQAFDPFYSTGYFLVIALLVGGLTGTARLLVSDHHPAQVYLGFFVGAFCQLVAIWI